MMARLCLALGLWLVSPAAALAAFAANNLSCNIFAPSGPGVLARCEGPSDALGDVMIELIGRAPNIVSSVTLSGGKNGFRQVLKVAAEPLVDVETVGVLFMDFNFDGLEDFALMEFLPAGPNVPYLYYLFDSKSGRFVPNKDLAAITSPEFLANEKEIVSHWRESAAVSGTDIYRWQNGKPQLTRRHEDRHSASGCLRTNYAMQDGKLAISSKGECL